jgi:thiamine transporter ThiT
MECVLPTAVVFSIRRFLSELLLILRLIRGIRIAGRVSQHRVRILLLAIVRGLQYGACLGLDLRYLAHDYRGWAVASRRVHVQNRVTVAP